MCRKAGVRVDVTCLELSEQGRGCSTYRSKTCHLSCKPSSCILGNTFKVEVKLWEDASVMLLPLADALNILGSLTVHILRNPNIVSLLACRSQFFLKCIQLRSIVFTFKDPSLGRER